MRNSNFIISEKQFNENYEKCLDQKKQEIVLGEGTFGKVYQFRKKGSNPEELVAVKM